MSRRIVVSAVIVSGLVISTLAWTPSAQVPGSVVPPAAAAGGSQTPPTQPAALPSCIGRICSSFNAVQLREQKSYDGGNERRPRAY